MERITKENEDGSISITAEDGRYRTRIEIGPTEPPYFCIEASVLVDNTPVLTVSDTGKTRSVVDWITSAVLSYREFEYPDLSIRPMARDLIRGKSDFILELSEREWTLRDDDVDPVSKTRVIFGSGSLRDTSKLDRVWFSIKDVLLNLKGDASTMYYALHKILAL